MPPRRTRRGLDINPPETSSFASCHPGVPFFPLEIMSLIVTSYTQTFLSTPGLPIIPLLQTSRAIRDVVQPLVYRSVVLSPEKQVTNFFWEGSEEGKRTIKSLELAVGFKLAPIWTMEMKMKYHEEDFKGMEKMELTVGAEGGRVGDVGLTKVLKPRSLIFRSSQPDLTRDLSHLLTYVSPPSSITHITLLTSLTQVEPHTLRTWITSHSELAAGTTKPKAFIPTLELKIIEEPFFLPTASLGRALCPNCTTVHRISRPARVPGYATPAEEAAYRNVLAALEGLVEKMIVGELRLNLYLVTPEIKKIVNEWAEGKGVWVGCDRERDEVGGLEALNGLDISTVPK